MRTNFSNSGGFTLAELLVVTAIIGVLMGLSVVNIKKIRELVYDAEFYAAKKDIWVALQVGSAYYEENNATTSKSTGTLSAGPITGWKQRLLPGIIVPKNIQVTASWNPREANGTCNGGVDQGMCFIRSVYVKHCKTLKYSYSVYYTWDDNEAQDGILNALFVNGGQPCT